MRFKLLAVHATRLSFIASMSLSFNVPSAWAIDFDVDTPFSDEPISANLNTTVTMGIGIRTQSPSTDLISKGNLNPNVCQNPPYQACQGLFRTQIFPAQHLVSAPGSMANNNDAGDLNYSHRGDVIQAPVKLTSDLTLKHGDFGFFGRILYFYDVRNNNFTEYHPNEITPGNVNDVGRVGSTLPISLGPVGGPCASLAGPLTTFLQPVLGPVNSILNGQGVPSLAPSVASVCGRFYGPGGVVRSKRTGSEELRQAGRALQTLDSYFYGKLPLWGDHELGFKIGRQLVNWGESTTLVINSINSANPVNANNFYRVGNQVEEDFVPVNMIELNFAPFDGVHTEMFYQLEWKTVEAPTPGTYFSDINIGTGNTGNTLTAGFGQQAEDPDCQAKLLDNILSGLTPTCSTISRLPDWKPRTAGQYGIKLDYYSEALNDGTTLALYYENYHSRLPYASFFSAYSSCGRREGNARHNDATDITSVLLDCPDSPLFHAGDPRQATSSLLQLETGRFVLEYPENIHLIGASFNTTVGSYSLQGEVAFRPNKPMQIDSHDLAFAMLGAQATRCGQPGINCQGTTVAGAAGVGVGFAADGSTANYPGSDAVDRNGNTGPADTINLVVGHVAGSQRQFPNFVIPYRGGVVGDNAPCYPKPGSADDTKYGFSGFSHPYYAYDRNSPCYIQGYQRMQDFEFNLGATKIYAATENWILADQVILLYELGAEYVPQMPAYDRLVLQGPNSTSGPTAGADGSGSNGSRMGCSNIPDCSYGPDGVRFNPHQQDSKGFPTSLSWGYRVIAQIDYEQILPGITLKPLLIWSHDVGGISPGPAGNFVRGRKIANAAFDFRYHQAVSLNLGYTMFFGGGVYNTLADRDYAQVSLKYQF